MSAPSIEQTLAAVFGFDELRPGQQEVIEDVLAGRPVVAVMPTGAGKSLCYQLPAVLLGAEGGVGLVVSPLIALMKDQVDSLTARGVSAAALTSASSPERQREILEGIRRGDYRLVYVAPERFRSPRFLEVLADMGDRLSLLAIDEAHCISEWGHEFRPDYRALGDVIARLSPPRLVALTATATPEVRIDIAQQLGVGEAHYHIRGFDRPNLRYSVERVGGAADKASRLVEHVRTRPSGTALVYVATRKNAEKHAVALGEQGMKVRVYHAGLADDDRQSAQDEFMAGKLDAIVATNAFGMGVDKSDIRVVIHADLPRSAEAYYQEAGRGGRDGEPAECVLLFNHGDVRLQEFLINASYPSGEQLRALWKLIREDPSLGGQIESLGPMLPGEPHASTVSSAARILARHGFLVDVGGGVEATRPDQLAGTYVPMDVESLERRAGVERSKLRSMVDYVYSTGCRRQYILDYFGDEDWDGRDKNCGGCDNCDGVGVASALTDDQVEHVLGLLKVVSVLPGRFGRTRLAAVANGSEDDERLIDLPERGILRGQTGTYLKDLFRALEGAALVEAGRGEYPTLSLTRRGKRVLAGDESIEGMAILLPERKTSRKRKVAAKADATDLPMTQAETDRGELLRDLRSRLASAAGIPAYVVFNNRTLEDIARRCPTSDDELLSCVGIGPGKLERFGQDILETLAS